MAESTVDTNLDAGKKADPQDMSSQLAQLEDMVERQQMTLVRKEEQQRLLEAEIMKLKRSLDAILNQQDESGEEVEELRLALKDAETSLALTKEEAKAAAQARAEAEAEAAKKASASSTSDKEILHMRMKSQSFERRYENTADLLTSQIRKLEDDKLGMLDKYRQAVTDMNRLEMAKDLELQLAQFEANELRSTIQSLEKTKTQLETQKATEIADPAASAVSLSERTLAASREILLEKSLEEVKVDLKYEESLRRQFEDQYEFLKVHSRNAEGTLEEVQHQLTSSLAAQAQLGEAIVVGQSAVAQATAELQQVQDELEQTKLQMRQMETATATNGEAISRESTSTPPDSENLQLRLECMSFERRYENTADLMTSQVRKLEDDKLSLLDKYRQAVTDFNKLEMVKDLEHRLSKLEADELRATIEALQSAKSELEEQAKEKSAAHSEELLTQANELQALRSALESAEEGNAMASSLSEELLTQTNEIQALRKALELAEQSHGRAAQTAAEKVAEEARPPSPPVESKEQERSELQTLESERDAATEKCRELHGASLKALEKVKQLEDEKLGLMDQYRQAVTDMNKLEAAKDMELELAQLETQDLRKSLQAVEEAHAEREKLAQEASPALKEELEAKVDEIQALQTALKSAEEAAQAAANRPPEQVVDTSLVQVAREELKERENEIQALKQSLGESQALRDQIASKDRQLDALTSDLEDKLKAHNAALSLKERRIDELRMDLEVAQKATEHSGLATSIACAECALSATRESILQKRLDEASLKLDHQEKLRQQFEDQYTFLKAHAGNEEETAALEKSLHEAQEQLASALRAQTTLGEVASTNRDAALQAGFQLEEAQDALQQSQALMRQLEMEKERSVEEQQQTVASLTSQLEEGKSQVAHLQSHSEEQQGRIASLEEDLEQAKSASALFQQHDQDRKQFVATLQAGLEEAKREATLVQQREQEHRELVTSLQTELEQAKARLSQTQQHDQEHMQTVTALEAKLEQAGLLSSQLLDEKEEQGQELTRLGNELEQAKTEAVAWSQTAGEHQQRVQSLERELEEARAAAGQLEQKDQEQQTALQALQGELAEAKLLAAQRQESMEASQRSTTNLQSELEEAKRQVQQLQQDAQEQQFASTTASSQLEEAKLQVAELQRQVQEQQNGASTVSAELEEAKARVALLAEQNEAHLESLNASNAELEEAKMQMRRLHELNEEEHTLTSTLKAQLDEATLTRTQLEGQIKLLEDGQSVSASLRAQLDEAALEKSVLESKVQALEEDLNRSAALKVQLEEATLQKSQLELQIKGLEEQQQAQLALKEELEEGQRQVAATRAELDEAKYQMEMLQEENQEQQRIISTFQEKLDEAAANGSSAAEAASKQLQQMQDELGQSQERFRQLEAESARILEEQQQKYAALQTQLEEAASKGDSAAASANAELLQTREELDQLKQMMRSSETTHAKTNEEQQELLAALKSQLEEEHQQTSAMLQARTEEVEQANAELQRSRDELTQVKELMRRYEADALKRSEDYHHTVAALKAQLEEAAAAKETAQAAQSNADLVRVSDELEQTKKQMRQLQEESTQTIQEQQFMITTLEVQLEREKQEAAAAAANQLKASQEAPEEGSAAVELEATKQQLRAVEADSARTIEEQKNMIVALQAQLQEARTASAPPTASNDEEVERLRQQNQLLVAQQDQLQVQLSQTATDAESLRCNEAELCRTLEEHKVHISMLEESLQKAQSATASVSASTDEVNELKTKNATLVAEQDALQAAFSAQIADIQRQLSEKTMEAEMLRHKASVAVAPAMAAPTQQSITSVPLPSPLEKDPGHFSGGADDNSGGGWLAAVFGSFLTDSDQKELRF